MRILIVHPHLSFRGSERVALHLARGLKESGHDPLIFFTKKDPALPYSEIPNYCKFPHQIINTIFQNNYIYLVLVLPVTLLYILYYARKADYIETEGFPCLWPSWVVAKLYRQKIIWIVHALESSEIYFKFISIIDHLLVPAISAAVTVSPQTERKVKQQYPGLTVHMLIPPINTDRLNNPHPGLIRNKYNLKQNKIILSVGILHPKKNQQLAIICLSKLNKIFPNHTLIIVGGGNTEALSRLANTLGVGNRVIFAGMVDDTEIKEYYCDSDLVLITSNSDQEGLGITAFEAFYLKKMCLTTKESGVSEIMQSHNFGLIAPSNPESYSLCINKYLSHPDNYATNITAGNSFVTNNLLISQYTKKFLELLNNVA